MFIILRTIFEKFKIKLIKILKLGIMKIGEDYSQINNRLKIVIEIHPADKIIGQIIE